MRRILEWVDKNGNKISAKNNINSTGANTASKNSSQQADVGSRLDTWNNFVDKATKYLKSRPELGYLKIDSHSNSKLQVFRIYDDLGSEIRISYNVVTEAFEINAGYDGFDTITGKGFNYLMQLLHDIAFTIFELGNGFDFLSLIESTVSQLADDFELYESLWG